MKKIALPVMAVIILILDRLSKVWVLGNITGKSKEVFSFLSFTYAENTGVAFGMFGGNNLFLLVFTVLIVAAMIYWRKTFVSCGLLSKLGFVLVLAGALGNIYDRIFYGFVVDFINFSFFPAIFNIADSAITVGACFMALGMKTKENEEKKIKS